MNGYGSFEFNLPDALLDQLVRFLDSVVPAQLISENVDSIPDAQGVYLLYHDDTAVYIGKTDDKHGFRHRLGRHAKKILQRQGLIPEQVTFKAARIYVFTTMDLEALLRKHYEGSEHGRPEWDRSGFGSNDPGRERETTNKPPEGFDATFPIDIDLPVLEFLPGEYTVADVLRRAKNSLPYLIRYETIPDRRGRGHPDRPVQALKDARMRIDNERMSTRQLLQKAVDALPPGWQATIFPSHAILYEESTVYRYGEHP